MELVYRALGLAASVNNALSRHSVNFVPGNLIIAAGAAAMLVFSVGGYLEATRNGRDPQPVALKDLSANPGARSFVRTSGILFPEAGFQYGEQDGNGNLKRVTMEFVPLVDRETARAVLVQLPPQHRFGAASRPVELTGMLRPMREFITRELRGTNFDYNGVHVLPGSVLVADDTPGDAALWQLGVVISGAIVGLFVVLTGKRNTIFVRGVDPAIAPVAVAVEPGEMHATGTFALEKHKRRFIDVPAVLSPLDNGDLAALANIDASSNFMGIKYADRAGIWMMHIAAGSISRIEEGTLYYGRRPMPAVRFRYREGISDRSRTAILSAPSMEARGRLLVELSSFRAAA